MLVLLEQSNVSPRKDSYGSMMNKALDLFLGESKLQPGGRFTFDRSAQRNDIWGMLSTPHLSSFFQAANA